MILYVSHLSLIEYFGFEPLQLGTALRRLVDISKGFETATGSLSASVRLA